MTQLFLQYSTDESTDTTTTTVYDMKIVTAKGDAYRLSIISVIWKKHLAYDEESSTAYLYIHKSDKLKKYKGQLTADSIHDESDDSDTRNFQ